MSATKKRAKAVAAVTSKRTGIFRDKVEVHTAPSGTQYVNPIDAFLTKEEMHRYAQEVRADKEDPGSTQKR